MSEDTRTNAERWGGQCSECKVYGGGHRWECSQDAPYRERYADALRCAGHAEADVRRFAGLEAEEGSIEGGADTRGAMPAPSGAIANSAVNYETPSDLDSQLATIEETRAEFCASDDEEPSQRDADAWSGGFARNH